MHKAVLKILLTFNPILVAKSAFGEKLHYQFQRKLTAPRRSDSKRSFSIDADFSNFNEISHSLALCTDQQPPEIPNEKFGTRKYCQRRTNKYEIRSLAELKATLGDFNYRILNRNLDFAYAVKNTIRFQLRRKRNNRAFDRNGRLVKRQQGTELFVQWIVGKGNSADWERLKNAHEL